MNLNDFKNNASALEYYIDRIKNGLNLSVEVIIFLISLTLQIYTIHFNKNFILANHSNDIVNNLRSILNVLIVINGGIFFIYSLIILLIFVLDRSNIIESKYTKFGSWQPDIIYFRYPKALKKFLFSYQPLLLSLRLFFINNDSSLLGNVSDVINEIVNIIPWELLQLIFKLVIIISLVYLPFRSIYEIVKKLIFIEDKNDFYKEAFNVIKTYDGKIEETSKDSYHGVYILYYAQSKIDNSKFVLGFESDIYIPAADNSQELIKKGRIPKPNIGFVKSNGLYFENDNQELVSIIFEEIQKNDTYHSKKIRRMIIDRSNYFEFLRTKNEI